MHLNPKQLGSVKINMTFGANLGVHITVLISWDFEGSFDIDGNASMLYDN